MDLLRIAARVAIRNLPYDEETGKKPPKFDVKEFKAITVPSQIVDYAMERLKPIGEGSSRTAFEYSSGKVLKIAKSFRGGGNSKAGVAQNKAEVDAYTNPRIKPITTKIFEYDTNFNWIISELVRPATSSEFKSYVGCPPYEAISLAEELNRRGEMDLEDFDDKPNTEFIESVASLLKEGTMGADLEVVDHWGKTSDGRIVVLDYGFTQEVFNDFYGPSEFKNYDFNYSDAKTTKIQESELEP